MHTNKKHYPDKNKIRRQSHLACKAIHGLTEIGIEVISVRFRDSNPKIEVAHCPGTDRLRSAMNGQGVDRFGQAYISRSTVYFGCQIEWHEARV